MPAAVANVQTPVWEVQINNAPLPCYGWDVVLGNYGSISQAHIHTSINMVRSWMAAATFGPGNNDLFNLAQDGGPLPLDVYASGEHVFGGAVDIEDFAFHTDRLVISGRDWAAPMVDSKRVLSDLPYLNTSPQQLAYQLALQYNLTPQISNNIIPGIAGSSAASKISLGTIFNNESALTVVPQQPWRILQAAARAAQCRCYVTPDRVLVFEPLGAVLPNTMPLPNGQTLQSSGVSNYKFCWMQSPSNTDSSSFPIIELDMKFQPRRNHSFIVQVYSDHHQTTQLTSGQTVVLGSTTPLPGVTAPGVINALGNTPSANAGSYSGLAGKQIQGLFKQIGSKVPSYSFQIPGKTPDQTQQIADAIAADIASHLFIFTLKVNGLSQIQVFDTIQIQDPMNQLFGKASGLFSVSGITHNASIGEGTGSQPGWTTTITALNIPAESTDNIASLGLFQ